MSSQTTTTRQSSLLDNLKWSGFCKNFHLNSEHTVYIDNMVRDTSALNAMVAESLSALTTSGASDRCRIRVFRHNSLDYSLTEQIAFEGRAVTEPLDALQCAGRNSEVCIAVNDMDAWGMKLAEACAGEVIPSLSVSLERDWLVVDWYSFISSPGWTPFGIHADDEPSLIFNLGPGTKTAWVWSPDALPALKGGRSTSLHFDALLSAAQSYTLHGGDFICIPAGHFHVFRGESSCTLLGAGLYAADYATELLPFLRSKTRGAEFTSGAQSKNLAVQLGAYLHTSPYASSQLDEYLRYLRNRTRSLSHSRKARNMHRTQVSASAIAAAGQHVEVTRHPVIVASERVILANGRALKLPDGATDAVALQTWLTDHKKFGVNDFLQLFTRAAENSARNIMRTLVDLDMLRITEGV